MVPTSGGAANHHALAPCRRSPCHNTGSVAALLQTRVSDSRPEARSRLALLAASSSSGSDSVDPQRSAGTGRDNSQNGAAPPQGDGRPPRRGKSLRRADVHGGQYRIQQHSDWVEPWITQTIPEDRLPQLQDLGIQSGPLPEAAEPISSAAKRQQQEEAGGAWVRKPHHLTRDSMWAAIQAEAQEQLKKEPGLAGFVHSYILMHAEGGLARALASLLANKLASRTLLPTQLATLFLQAYGEDEDLMEACVADLHAVMERDAACYTYIQPLLFFKGFQALQAYRLAHWLWLKDRKNLALTLQNRMSEVLHVDIHPGAQIGRGVLIDHATGVVVGETAVIGDGVSLLHRVTLGGSGVRDGKRHPTIGNGVLLGAAVSVLGPVTVGAAAKVGAGSVVTSDLPPACVAVGVPARIIKTNHTPPTDMDQCEDFILDYVI